MANPGADQSNPSGTITEAAKEKAEHLTDRITKGAAELKRQAERTADDLRERARSAAADQKNATALRVEGVAQALRRASDDLLDQGQPMVAEYSRQAAKGLESFADTLGRRDVDELVGNVEDFARTRPVVFLGGAVAAGFALARFMKSSAARRSQRAGRDRTSYAGATSAAATAPGAAMPTAAIRPAPAGMATATATKEAPDATR
jgi:hypothetical protein